MRTLAAVLLLAVLAIQPATGQSRSEQSDALAVLNGVLSIETELLKESLREYGMMTVRRDEIASRLKSLEEALDAAIGDSRAAEAGRLDQLIEQVQLANGERSTLFTAGHLLLERISDRHQRVLRLHEQVEALEGREVEQDLSALTGVWDIVLLPVELRGVCTLKQEGAVVSGTYEFAGGFKGSLQGTLVDRKVYLIRIDTKLGKMMEFEGFLSGDGQLMRGSWLNYELAGADGATGQWTAERRAPRP